MMPETMADENIDRVVASIMRNRGLNWPSNLKNLLVTTGARPSKSAAFAQAMSRCGNHIAW
jgi:hypothetical protein